MSAAVGHLFRHADIRDRTIPPRANKVVISFYWLFPAVPFIIQMCYIFARLVREAARLLSITGTEIEENFRS